MTVRVTKRPWDDRILFALYQENLKILTPVVRWRYWEVQRL